MSHNLNVILMEINATLIRPIPPEYCLLVIDHVLESQTPTTTPTPNNHRNIDRHKNKADSHKRNEEG